MVIDPGNKIQSITFAKIKVIEAPLLIYRIFSVSLFYEGENKEKSNWR